MRLHRILFVVLLSLYGSLAMADPVTYNITVNTSSISGTAGSLDFNFNPGPLITQAASLQILSFASNGNLTGAPSLVGHVSGGPLPLTLTFDNGTAFNDYFQGFTYGSILAFQVRFFGPALSSPDGTSTSGSTFAFSMFSDAAGTIPALTTDTINGFAFTTDVNTNGKATATNFSSQTSISTVPEPSSLELLGTAIGVLGTLRILGKGRWRVLTFLKLHA